LAIDFLADPGRELGAEPLPLAESACTIVFLERRGFSLPSLTEWDLAIDFLADPGRELGAEPLPLAESACTIVFLERRGFSFSLVRLVFDFGVSTSLSLSLSSSSSSGMTWIRENISWPR